MPSRLLTADTSYALPSLQTVIQQKDDGTLTTNTAFPLPILEPGTVLVQTFAVGLNPTDFKMPANFPTPGAVAGCDFAGVVVQVPDSSSSAVSTNDASPRTFQLGDRVCGAVHGSNPVDTHTGAFASYIRAPADMLVRLPKHVTWAQGAALGLVGHGTVAQAMWSCFGLTAAPNRPAAEVDAEYVLVYGGSTATGTMAIQMLRLSGLRPIAVCSPRNFALARQYGAAAVFDYMSPSCGADIRAYTENALWYALDCISDRQSAEICYAALGRAGGSYVCLEAQDTGSLASRKAIRTEFLMGYDMFGKGVALPGAYHREPDAARHELSGGWFATLERLLSEDKIKSHPVKVVGSGWQDILDGLDVLRRGDISGTKLVVEVSSFASG